MDLPNQIRLAVGIAFSLKKNGKPLNVAPEWALSLATQSYPLATNISLLSLKGVEIGEARSHFARQAKEMGASYLWLIDDDVAPCTGAIRALMYQMEQHKHEGVMAVGGIYCSKSDLPEPVVFRGSGQGCFWHWKLGEVFECDGIGTGCLLINTEVFDYLEEPYFKTVDKEPVAVSQNQIVYREQQTDDLYFCDKVRRAGFKILAHGGVICPHWDADTGKPYLLLADSYPCQPTEALAAKGA